MECVVGRKVFAAPLLGLTVLRRGMFSFVAASDGRFISEVYVEQVENQAKIAFFWPA
jgi:hypothetical protein